MTSHQEFPAGWPTEWEPDAYRSGPATDPLEGIDGNFVFDFRSYDEIGDGQRWTTWFDVEPLSRGPEPRPSWVVESRGAIDSDLGIGALEVVRGDDPLPSNRDGWWDDDFADGPACP